MSTDRDVERIVRSWMDEGVTVLPDRVLDLVLDRIPATPQRRAGWPAWRTPPMRNMSRVALAAAAAVVLVFIGYRLLISPNVGGPGPADTSSPVASPTASASFGQADFVIKSPYLTYAEVHAPFHEGWEQRYNFVSRSDDTIGFSAWTTDGVYADPCHWQGSLIEIGKGDEEGFFAALTRQPGREPSALSEYPIGGWGSAMRIELSVPADLDLATCDLSRYNAWMDVSEPGGGNWNHKPGQSDIVVFVDIDRHSVVIDAWLRAGATTEDRAELEEMLASIEVGFHEDFASPAN